MASNRDMHALVMVRENRDKSYEIRIAIYGSGGALVREEIYSGVRSIDIDAGMNITKIGYGELYLLSRNEITVSFKNDKRAVIILASRSNGAAYQQGGRDKG